MYAHVQGCLKNLKVEGKTLLKKSAFHFSIGDLLNTGTSFWKLLQEPTSQMYLQKEGHSKRQVTPRHKMISKRKRFS